MAPPTLMITIDGIASKPRYVDGRLQARELLDITISVDHEVVDGAPAARFARRLAELLSRPTGCQLADSRSPPKTLCQLPNDST